MNAGTPARRMDPPPGREETLEIVIVEDNAGDVLLVREALEEAGFAHALTVVASGSGAVEALRRSRAGAGRGPDLVIMDLNLPGRSGRQIMAEMQEAPDLRSLPVAVFTTSPSEIVITGEFPGLHVTFAAKTPHFGELVDIMKRFGEFARQYRLSE
jgi:CheY-like chemotaxis protein